MKTWSANQQLQHYSFRQFDQRPKPKRIVQDPFVASVCLVQMVNWFFRVLNQHYALANIKIIFLSLNLIFETQECRIYIRYTPASTTNIVIITETSCMKIN